VAVIGGLNSFGFQSSIEILDFSDEKKECTPLPEYPLSVAGLTAAFYDDSLMACGGFNLSVNVTACYKLNSNLESWELVGHLPAPPHVVMASSVVDDKWVLTYGSSLIVFHGTSFN